MEGGRSMYLFLSSSDSIPHHPSNMTQDFILELHKPLELEGEWEVALTDIIYEEQPFAGRVVVVYSDLCGESYIGERMGPVLRPMLASRKSRRSEVFQAPYYVPVAVTSVSRIRVYIKDREMNQLSVTNRPTVCSLHLRRKGWTLQK